MTYAFFNVRVSLRDHSMIQTPEQAKRMLENVLNAHPAMDLFDIQINVIETRAVHSEEGVHNVFEDHETHPRVITSRSRRMFDDPRP